MHVIRPYSEHKQTEIVKSPKVYGFDTGFVCYAKGWREIRPADTGVLWEHCVLNELHALSRTHLIHYWRDKQGHEVDFVIPNKRDNSLIAIECKFSLGSDVGGLSLKSLVENIEVFRAHYPKGENYFVAHDIAQSFTRQYRDLTFTFIPAQKLKEYIS